MSCWRFPVEISFRFFNSYFTFGALRNNHPRRPRGSQSNRGKRRHESFQAQAEEPLDTDSHRTISKRSSEWWLLIGHKKCFLLLCPISEHNLLSSFQAVCVKTHKGSWVKLLLCLISIVTRSSWHLVKEMNQTQGSKHCFLLRKTLRKRTIWRIFKISWWP